jgi:hypothetical protein
MDRLERLEAIDEIRTLKARYFRLMDTKQWDGFAALFTDDLKILSPEGTLWLHGGPAFGASIRHSLEHAVSCHQGFTAEIEIVDAQTAKAVWSMQDVIEWKDRHPREGWKSIVGRGHYHETYRRLETGWRIATLSLSRLRLDIVWPADRA